MEEIQIYGQWWGVAESDNKELKYRVLVSIDKCNANTSGSLSLQAANANSLSSISRILFSEVTKEGVKINILDFLGFNGNEVLPPTSGPEYFVPHDGFCEFQYFLDERQGESLQGVWSSRFKQGQGDDLIIRGEVKLFKVREPRAKEIDAVITWEEFKTKISEKDKYPEGTFFRGQADSIKPLRTSYHREDCWDLYRYRDSFIPELFDELGLMSNQIFPYNDGSDFGRPLLLAQHHGYPTPLLDWTLSPYIAAYFAFRDYPKAGISSARIFIFHKDRWCSDQKSYLEGNFLSPYILVKPLDVYNVGNKRAISQMGTCLFSNVENIENVLEFAEFVEPGTEAPAPYLEIFDISYKEQEKILKDLRSMNIHETSLFPDMDGVCRKLKNKHFKRS